MKKMLRISFLAILLVGIGFTAHAQFGYLNSAEILNSLPEVKQANSNLEALQKQLVKQGEGMVEKLQQNYLEIQKKIERGDLSPKEQATEEQKLQEEQAKIQEFERSMVDKISAKRDELFKPIYEKINTAIKEVANDQGLKFVFDQQVLLFAEESEDVSAAVKAKLGIN